MPKRKKKKRGGQLGNQNARKHGFYSRFLPDATSADIERASQMQGLDAEIALLRLKLKDLLEHSPERADIQLQAAHTIALLLKIQYQITEEQRLPLKEAISRVLTEVALPLGLDIKLPK